jgi:hypothetical protein
VGLSCESSAIELSRGDILIDGPLKKGYGLYLLRKDHNYYPVKLPTKTGWHVYDFDRSRNWVYMYEGARNFFYVDFSVDPPMAKEIGFLPEGMRISSVASNGSCLILKKPVYDDIFIEENPNFIEPFGSGGTTSMLFKYDMETGEVNRLTYSYGQETSWVTPDGECLAYKYYLQSSWTPPGWETGIIFCRADGTGKVDLRLHFLEAGIDGERITDWFWFAPKLGYELSGEKYYYAIFRPEKRWGDEVAGPGTLDYYYAKLKYEGDELRCEVTKKFIDVPEGVELWNFFSEPSLEHELYFFGSIKGENGGIIRYDVYDDSFYAIPNTGVFLSFLVY